MKTITVKAPVNIAVIKYWGKIDENMIIPLNDSISGTLSMDELCTTTSIVISDKFISNRMWINGEELQIQNNKRLMRCIQYIKTLAGDNGWPSNEFINVYSINNFPTAAGLASSAAGYAGLIYALCKLFSIDDLEYISKLARLGSGSACRSIYGGLVQWVSGNSMNTSMAKQIITEHDWPEICVLILIFDDHKKDTSSTIGMQLSCKTSQLIKYRASQVVPERCQKMIKAIQNRNFHEFAEVTMKDSNQFHAICQDTYPPIRYMNDMSWSVVNFIHFINDFYGKNIAAYTFDAGPNSCIYCLKEHVSELISLICQMYPKSDRKLELPIRGILYEPVKNIDSKLLNYVQSKVIKDGLKYIISTKLGSGPQVISNQFDFNCFFNSDGSPKIFNLQ